MDDLMEEYGNEYDCLIPFFAYPLIRILQVLIPQLIISLLTNLLVDQKVIAVSNNTHRFWVCLLSVALYGFVELVLIIHYGRRVLSHVCFVCTNLLAFLVIGGITLLAGRYLPSYIFTKVFVQFRLFSYIGVGESGQYTPSILICLGGMLCALLVATVVHRFTSKWALEQMEEEMEMEMEGGIILFDEDGYPM